MYLCASAFLAVLYGVGTIEDEAPALWAEARPLVIFIEGRLVTLYANKK